MCSHIKLCKIWEISKKALFWRGKGFLCLPHFWHFSCFENDRFGPSKNRRGKLQDLWKIVFFTCFYIFLFYLRARPSSQWASLFYVYRASVTAWEYTCFCTCYFLCFFIISLLKAKGRSKLFFYYLFPIAIRLWAVEYTYLEAWEYTCFCTVLLWNIFIL